MERKQWNDLSMTEKSEMMKVAVRNGITNLNDIRQAYNEFADGGNIVTPVTTSGSGYIPTAVMPSQIVEDAKNKIIKDVMGELPMEEVRRRLYKNLYPHGYDDYKNRFRNAVKNNQSELYKYKYPFWERGRAGDVRVPIFGEYLQIPVNEREDNIYGRQLLESQYTPTKGKEQGITYYRIPGFPGEVDKENLIADSYGMYNPWNEGNWEYRQTTKIDKELNKKQINDLVEARNKSVGIDENKLSSVLGSAFCPHTLGRGYDAKGEYVSYYDKWDLAPYKHQGEDQSNGIGKPVHFYDRIYLDDFYQVPTKYRGGYYLPEVTITPEKAFGGPLVQLAKKFENGGGFDEALGEIVKWNQTDPNTGERSPFYSREHDTYGTVQLPEVEVSTSWTPQGLRNAAAREGRQYMYDAQQQGYNVVGPLLSTLVSAPMDYYPIETLLTGFRRAGATAQGNKKLAQASDNLFQGNGRAVQAIKEAPAEKWAKGTNELVSLDKIMDRIPPKAKWYARTAYDVFTDPMRTMTAAIDGSYIHDINSMLRNYRKAMKEVGAGIKSTNDQYLSLTGFKIPEARYKIERWSKFDKGSRGRSDGHTIWVPLTRNRYSNITQHITDFRRTAGHEQTHIAEKALHDATSYPYLDVWDSTNSYYPPNPNHPVATKYKDAFMKANYHGKSPEETWANYMGSKASGMSWKEYVQDNLEREDIVPPEGFIEDYKKYLTDTYMPIAPFFHR